VVDIRARGVVKMAENPHVVEIMSEAIRELYSFGTEPSECERVCIAEACIKALEKAAYSIEFDLGDDRCEDDDG
jgi:hypothetical protein